MHRSSKFITFCLSKDAIYIQTGVWCHLRFKVKTALYTKGACGALEGSWLGGIVGEYTVYDR